MNSGPRIAVLMTCHNRRAKTLAALAALFAQRGLPPGTTLTVHLVDADSADGTADAVRAAFPEVDVVSTGADVYWGTGTRMAAERAPASAHVMWLNDDVVLHPEALAALMRTAGPMKDPVVVVGATRSGDGTRTTYGGHRLRRGTWRPPRLEPVEPHRFRPLPIDTCNGNVVLVTAAARRRLGDLDASFPHRIGDTDYGFRARAAGVPLLLAPGHSGDCDDHPPSEKGSSKEPGIGPRLALRRLASVREAPPGPWWTYCRRHLGLWGVLTFFSPYVKTVLGATARRSRGYLPPRWVGGRTAP